MHLVIDYNQATNFTGRNGSGIQSGLDLLALNHRGTVMLAPLTSRKAVGRCDLEIPSEDIPAVIAALREAQKALKPAKKR